jgi:flagellar biosynthesis protein FlhG
MHSGVVSSLDRPQIWAIAGGKGGTGKSLLAASLGIHLARSGHRVVLVDADLGAPNLHTALGMDSPVLSLGDFIHRRVPTLVDAMVETGLPRLSLISGARNSLDAESLKHFQKTRLLREMLYLPAEIVIVDLGAGTSLNVLDVFCLADRGVMVILPEPTSVENCYRFLTAAFMRRLQRTARALGYEAIVDLVLEMRERSRLGRPVEVLEEIRRVDACAGRALAEFMEPFLPHLVINQARDHEDVRLGDSMQTVTERFIRIPLGYAGAIPYEPAMVQTVKSRRPFMVEYPRSRAAERIRAVADAIGGTSGEPRARRPPATSEATAAPDPYFALDLPPTARADAILEGYLRLRRTFRSGSPALTSLDCESERRAAVEQIERAYRSLSRNLSVPVPSSGRFGPRTYIEGGARRVSITEP